MSGFDTSLRASSVVNLSSAVTMVVDDSPFALDLTCQALLGFGIRTRYACRSAAEAIRILKESPVDLVLVDCEMPGTDGFEMVRWLRRSGLDPNAFTPIIMTAAHLRRSRATEARDCGASFVIVKPFSPVTLLERIVWVSRDQRPFLEVGDYFGPDRRFRDGSPPGDERREQMIRKAAAQAEAAAQGTAEVIESSVPS
ncbi:response regulator [uncultured Brevundimonas sp.]|uniref:response regulator n=1 Tax=uncultured Brevundimonas sp. TaxID=213418 RepID=UPI0030EF5C59|tara:strand:+ start:1802 stop:2395 length:594 start_codon:yes stop_codon:yes gene_type:complete